MAFRERCNGKWSSCCNVEKALCDITELIKSCEMGNFVKKKIQTHRNLLKGLMTWSLLHTLPLNRAAGKDSIFAEHVSMLIQAFAITVPE